MLFPLPSQVYSPPKKDMSWTGLPEFADDTITDYSRPLPSIESNSSDLQNSNSSVSEHGESSSSIMSKPMIKFVKAADYPEIKTNKVKTTRKSSVKYAEMYRNNSKSPKFRGKTWPKNNFAHKNVTYRADLLKTSRTPIALNRTNKNVAQPKRTSFAKTTHSYVRRTFHGRSAVRTQSQVPRVSTVTKRFPTVDLKFSTAKSTFTADLGNNGKAVKEFPLPVKDDPTARAFCHCSLVEGLVPGKDLEGSRRLTCHDVSGESLAVTRWGTFMKRILEECYDLIENMTAHYNDWDTSAHRGESSSSTTSSSSEIAALAQQMAKMRKDMLQMYRLNQQVYSVTPSCETCGGPHSYYECQAANGYTQEVYATSETYNTGVLRQLLISNQTQQDFNQSMQNKMAKMKKILLQIPQGMLPSNTEPNPREDIKAITIRIGIVLDGPSVLPPSPSFKKSPPASASFEIPFLPISFKPPKRNPHQPPIPYPSSLAEALALMPKYHKMLKELLSDKEKLLGLANTSLTENFSAVLLKKLSEKLRDPGRFLIPSGIAEDVCIQVGKFTFPVDLVVVDYDVDPCVPLILGRPFLRTAQALVNVYREELILRDGSFLEVLNIKKSNHPFSGSTTFSFDSSPSLTPFETSDSLLEDFTDELALLDPFPLGNKDDNFNPETDLRVTKYFLNRDSLTDSLPTIDIDIIDLIFKRTPDVAAFKKVEEISKVEIRLLALSVQYEVLFIRGSDLAGSLAEGSVPGKDPKGSRRLTCHDVSGGSLAVT
nr:hypothetical protein [Tanacetum cinerariifolium]